MAGTFDKTIALVIQAKDQATGAIDKIKNSFDGIKTSASAAFSGANTSANTFKNTIGSVGQSVNGLKSGFSGMAGSITALSTGFLALTSGIQTAWSTYRNLTTVQLENAAVWERLNISIVAFGENINNIRPQVEAFAANAREVYGLDNEDVTAMMIQLATATGSWGAALKLAEPAVIAVQSGLVELSSVAGVFARAQEGETMMLERSFPVLKAYREQLEATAKANGEVVDKHQIGAAVIKKFMEIFGKLAAEQSESQKALREYDNQIEDLQIALAEILPDFKKILEVLKSSITFFANNAQAISLMWKAFAGYKILTVVITSLGNARKAIIALELVMFKARLAGGLFATTMNAITLAGLGIAIYAAINNLGKLKTAIQETIEAGKMLDKSFADSAFASSKLDQSLAKKKTQSQISKQISVETDPKKKADLERQLMERRRGDLASEYERTMRQLEAARAGEKGIVGMTGAALNAFGIKNKMGRDFEAEKNLPKLEEKLKRIKKEMGEVNNEYKKLYANKGDLPLTKALEKQEKKKAAAGGGKAGGGDPFAEFLGEQEKRSRFADEMQDFTGGFSDIQKAKLDLEYWNEALKKGIQLVKEHKKEQYELTPIYAHINDAREKLNQAMEKGNKEAQKELKYKQEIASLQKEVERVGEEQHFAGYEEAMAKAKDDFAQYTDELKKGYEGTLNELSAKTTEQHEKISNLSRESYDLKKKNTELEELANLYALKHNLTLEEQAKFQNEIAFAMQRLGKTNEEALSIQQQYLRESIELSIVLNEQTGLAAEITRYQGQQQMLASHMYKDLAEQASMMSNIYDFEMRIADEYGVTREEAVAMLPILKSMTKEELDRFKTLRNINKTYDEQLHKMKLFEQLPGLDENFSRAGSEADALKAKIIALYDAGTDMGILKPLYMEQQQLKAIAEQEALVDPKKAAEEAKRLAEEFHKQMRDGLASAIEEGFDKGGMAAVENFAKFLKNRIKKEAAEGLADALMGRTAQGNIFTAAFGGGKAAPGGVAGAAAAITPGNLMEIFGPRAGGAMPPGAAIADYMKTPAAKNAFAEGWGSMMSRQPGAKNMAFAEGWASMMSRQPQPQSAASAAAQMAQAGGMAIPGGAGGAMGFLGKSMPYLGAAMLIAGMFKKGPGAPMSGVAGLPTQATNIFGGGLDVLRGSDVYRRAAFSSRNINQSLTSAMAAPRLRDETKIVVTVEPSAEFDTKVKGSLADGVRLSSTRGVPRRTGFTHG